MKLKRYIIQMIKKSINNFFFSDNRDENEQSDENFKRQRSSYNGEQLYPNVSKFLF